MSNYIEIILSIEPDQHEWWIAKLYDIGIENFVEETDHLSAFLEPVQWKSMEKDIRSLLQTANLECEIKVHETQDWNALWESNFDPIELEDKLYVRASFHPILQGFKHQILIAPKMAFGTGHHATTLMILRWLSKHLVDGMDVLDFGCGTGILGIYAKLKNCHCLTLIDNDAAAVENCHEHCSLNKVAADEILLGSAEAIPDKMYDLIFANITRNILEEHLPQLVSHLKTKGSILISGFLVEDKEAMSQLLSRENIEVIEIMQEKDWLAIQGKKL